MDGAPRNAGGGADSKVTLATASKSAGDDERNRDGANTSGGGGGSNNAAGDDSDDLGPLKALLLRHNLPVTTHEWQQFNWRFLKAIQVRATSDMAKTHALLGTLEERIAAAVSHARTMSASVPDTSSSLQPAQRQHPTIGGGGGSGSGNGGGAVARVGAVVARSAPAPATGAPLQTQTPTIAEAIFSAPVLAAHWVHLAQATKVEKRELQIAIDKLQSARDACLLDVEMLAQGHAALAGAGSLQRIQQQHEVAHRAMMEIYNAVGRLQKLVTFSDDAVTWVTTATATVAANGNAKRSNATPVPVSAPLQPPTRCRYVSMLEPQTAVEVHEPASAFVRTTGGNWDDKHGEPQSNAASTVRSKPAGIKVVSFIIDVRSPAHNACLIIENVGPWPLRIHDALLSRIVTDDSNEVHAHIPPHIVPIGIDLNSPRSVSSFWMFAVPNVPPSCMGPHAPRLSASIRYCADVFSATAKSASPRESRSASSSATAPQPSKRVASRKPGECHDDPQSLSSPQPTDQLASIVTCGKRHRARRSVPSRSAVAHADSAGSDGDDSSDGQPALKRQRV